MILLTPYIPLFYLYQRKSYSQIQCVNIALTQEDSWPLLTRITNTEYNIMSFFETLSTSSLEAGE
jgi:hypothetical protein